MTTASARATSGVPTQSARLRVHVIEGVVHIQVDNLTWSLVHLQDELASINGFEDAETVGALASSVESALSMAPSADVAPLLRLLTATPEGVAKLLVEPTPPERWAVEALLRVAPALVLETQAAVVQSVLTPTVLDRLADRPDCVPALLRRSHLPVETLRRIFEAVTDQGATQVRAAASARGRNDFSSLGPAFRERDRLQSLIEEGAPLDKEEAEWRRALHNDPHEWLLGDDEDIWDVEDLQEFTRGLPDQASLTPLAAEQWVSWMLDSDDAVVRAALAASVDAVTAAPTLSQDADRRVRKALLSNDVINDLG